MKLRKLSKEELKAKAKKYAPLIITVTSTLAGTAGLIAAGVYAKKMNEAERQLDHYLAEDEDAWPAVEVTPNVMKDVRAGATMLLRMYHTDDPDPRTVVQMTTREEGFPAEADEDYSKGTPGEAPYSRI